MNTDLEYSSFQKRGAYRYIRRSDHLPPISPADRRPVAKIKLFNPTGTGTWYLAEYEPETRRAYGIAFLGADPELGYIDMVELVEFRGLFGLPIERDLYWSPVPLGSLLLNEAQS